MERDFKRVLIVDDDLAQIPLWKHIIGRSSEKASIDWAVSAEQAKTIMVQAKKNKKKFDLIIVDLFLAGSETGLEFLETKEVQNCGADTILVSAANKANLEQHIQTRLKKTKVIVKPLNVVRCEKVLNELIR